MNIFKIKKVMKNRNYWASVQTTEHQSQNLGHQVFDKKSQGMIRAVLGFCFLSLLLCILPQAKAAVGDKFDQGNFTFTILSESGNEGTVSIVANRTSSGVVHIPSQVSYSEVNYSVISIGNDGFRDSSLTGITIPDSVTSIGSSAFWYCHNLKSIVIPDSVTSIEPWAFHGCSGLTSVIIGKNLASIQGYTFIFCTSLTNVIIGNSVTSINEAAFHDCTSLRNITIPAGVTFLGDGAFYSCISLLNVYFEGSAPSVGERPFFNTPSGAKAYVMTPGQNGWPEAGSMWRGLLVTPTGTGIITQPQSQMVAEGDSATFSVVASGAPPLYYQWKKEGDEIPGATESNYTISDVTSEDAGSYTVTVSNEAGSVTSDEAMLTLLVPPVIDQQPESQHAMVGDDVTFFVTIKEPVPMMCQWYKNGVAIAGATETFYTIESVKGTDAAQYNVVLSNDAGSAVSNLAVLSLEPYRATATAQVVNGFIVGFIVTDGGYGYEKTPNMRIYDSTGTGGIGHCIVENGMVIGIVVDNAGSNYTQDAMVKIASPLNLTSLSIEVSQVRVNMRLVLGELYQLESSKDCVIWEKVGEPFIAEEEEMSIEFEVADYGRYFRIYEVN